MRSRDWFLLGPLLWLAATGCVMRSTYSAVVSERDRLATQKETLEERVRQLELSNAALDSERVRLIDQTEDLRQERSELETSVAALRATEEKLSRSLALTEEELAAQREEVAKLRGTYEGLVSDLESEVAAGQIQIEQLREGLRLNVSDEILFASGSSVLGTEGEALLRKVSAQLAPLDQRVEVRGHTDNLPISGRLRQRYPSNWELAGARAASVVRLLQHEGIRGARLAAVSLAEFQPVAPNDSPQHRALNRRIEIRLLPPDPDALDSPTSTKPPAQETGAGPGA